MTFTEIIPSHKVAGWILDQIDHILSAIGLGKERVVEEIVYVIVIAAIALFIGWAVRRLVLAVARKMVKMRNSQICRELLEQRVLTKCSHIIPPLVLLGLMPVAFESGSKILDIAERITIAYLLVVIAVAINTVLTFFWMRFDRRENTKNLPLKGILNVAVGIVWIIMVICCICVLLNKSPGWLLTGLTAFAAALMLVFKDTILGFVAGIQLSQNDMVRVGDWIVVPSTIANGIVTDVSLTTVKVQNWDNTIVTLPPYTLVSSSFQNWRGMSDSGARQICRAVIFDTYYIKPCTDELLTAVAKKYPVVKPFIDNTLKQGKPTYDPGLACVNGTLETNLGLYRAYLCEYLLNHPLILNTQQILVRVMVPTGTGMPLQIWCFTTTKWTAYEAVQSEIFEHIATTCKDFGLQLFNYPSGVDVDTVQVYDPEHTVTDGGSTATDTAAATAG